MSDASHEVLDPAIALRRMGQCVQCPADRGDPAYTGIVRKFGTNVYTNIRGVRYVWVTVQRPDKHNTMWPSHRIGVTLPPASKES